MITEQGISPCSVCLSVTKEPCSPVIVYALNGDSGFAQNIAEITLLKILLKLHPIALITSGHQIMITISVYVAMDKRKSKAESPNRLLSHSLYFSSIFESSP